MILQAIWVEVQKTVKPYLNVVDVQTCNQSPDLCFHPLNMKQNKNDSQLINTEASILLITRVMKYTFTVTFDFMNAERVRGSQHFREFINLYRKLLLLTVQKA